MAWLATGSYQSKPTASMLRGRGDAYTASSTRRGAWRRVAPRRRGPGRTTAELAHRAVRGHRGEEPAYHRLPGVARREGGVVDRPALVHVAVDVVGIHAGLAQLQQVEQHAVVLVDRRRARVHRHLGLGLHRRDDVGRQHVRGQDVVEGAEGVGDGHAPARRARRPRSSP